MTMFHWLNCMLITFCPHYLLYWAAQPSYSSGRMTIAIFSNAVFTFLLTQIAKIVVVASLLPHHGDADTSSQHIASTFIIRLIDLCGLYYVLNRSARSRLGFVKICIFVGLGWGFAESLAHYLLPLWLNARGMEFDWQFIHWGIQSNVSLVRALAPQLC